MLEAELEDHLGYERYYSSSEVALPEILYTIKLLSGIQPIILYCIFIKQELPHNRGQNNIVQGQDSEVIK